VATYDYPDETGKLLHQTVRYEPKAFKQRRPDGNGGWIWNLDGIRLVLYGLPELRAADPKQEVLIPEGEKDVKSARSQGYVATCNPMGAGKWQSSYNGYLKGRRVCVLPDLDARGRRHAEQVARSLHGVAETVTVVELPFGDAQGKDLTDWLALGHTRSELDALVASAPLWTPQIPSVNGSKPAAPQDQGRPKGLVPQLAARILEANNFAQDSGGKMYTFRDGVYQPGGEAFIRQRVKNLLGKWDVINVWTSHRAEEVVEFIRVDAPHLWPAPPADTINVTNGLLDIATRKLSPHSPDYLCPIQINAAYDASAPCPAWDKFIAQVLPADDIAVVWELVGKLMTARKHPQKAVLFTGEGGNGKSRLIEGIRAFLGKRNTASLSLQRLEADRFAVARLIGKLANLCPDLPSEHLAGTSVFKALTGGDQSITGEYKFRDSFDFDPFCGLVFSAHRPPRSSDDSQAFFDRWLVLHFPTAIRGTAGEVSAEQLDAILAAPGELSGVLNKALNGLEHLKERGRFEITPSMQTAFEEFQAQTDPLAVYLSAYTVSDPDGLIPRSDLISAYNRWATSEGRTGMTATAFGLAIKRLRADVGDKQRTVNGRVAWCYTGINFPTLASISSRTQRSSRTSSNLSSPREGLEEAEVLESAINKQKSVKSVNSVKAFPPVQLPPKYPRPARCDTPLCESTDFWQLLTGEWRCQRCHPDPRTLGRS